MHDPHPLLDCSMWPKTNRLIRSSYRLTLKGRQLGKKQFPSSEEGQMCMHAEMTIFVGAVNRFLIDADADADALGRLKHYVEILTKVQNDIQVKKLQLYKLITAPKGSLK